MICSSSLLKRGIAIAFYYTCLQFYYIDLRKAMASAERAFDWLRHALLGAKSSVFGPKSFKFECSNSGFLLKPNHLVGFVREFRVGTGKIGPFDWEIGESDPAGKLNRDRGSGHGGPDRTSMVLSPSIAGEMVWPIRGQVPDGVGRVR